MDTGDMQCLPGLLDGYRASRTFPDCDDSNPNLNQTIYVDADGDGFGSPTNTKCVAQIPKDGMPPPGTSLREGDCNDADPDVHPGAQERWHDGVDSDCNGSEDPLNCDGAKGDCGCELLGVPSIPITSGCAGPDLFLAKVVTCQGCGGQTVIAIGNRGSAAASNVTFTIDGEPMPAMGPLAPGAITLPIVVPYNGQKLVIANDPAECDIANNVADVPSSAGICDP
jgi:hypothetical protein